MYIHKYTVVGTFGVYFAPWSEAHISTVLWTDTFLFLPCFSPCFFQFKGGFPKRILHFISFHGTLFFFISPRFPSVQTCLNSSHFVPVPFKIVSRHFTSFAFI